MELVYLLVVGLVIWYGGTTISAILSNSATLAEKEFKSFSREQDIRLHKTRAKQTTKVKELSDLEVMSDKEFMDFFAVISKDLDKE